MKYKTVGDLNLEIAQNHYLEIANKLSEKIGKTVLFEFYRGEFELIYKVRYYLTAPCGCCRTTPHVYPSDFEDMLNKFKKLSELDTIIRKNTEFEEEYGMMYNLDLFDSVFDELEVDYSYNKEQLERFYSMDNNEIVDRFKKEYYKYMEEVEENE